MPSFPANIDLASLDGSNGFKLSVVAYDDGSGDSVASAGDVNGDGFDDVIIGAPWSDPHGGCYVVFGKASGFAANLNLSSLDGDKGFTLSGVETDLTGFSVASAGDVNGDGFADMIVGALGGNASYVVFGKASGFSATFDLSGVDGSDGFKLSGVGAHGDVGRTVASAGDVNGDGFDDLIVGDVEASPHGNQSGASYVVFGKASGFAANLNLSSLDGTNGFKLSGVALFDLSGSSVASAGDVNGDGFGDVIIGAWGDRSGGDYVVFGKASGFAANLELSSLDGSNGFKIAGIPRNTSDSYVSAGDVNGDGFDDLIVGADDSDPHGDGSGATYVVFGKASGFAATFDASSLDGSTGFKISGVAPGDYSGRSVASAGDVNNDGFADLIIGAEEADPHGSRSGASYVVFGRASGFGANLDLSTIDGYSGFKLSGAAAGDHAGDSVASAGDVNGDGFADVIVGASFADPHGEFSGASYVVFGHATDAPPQLVGTDGPDTLTGGGANDTIDGLAGDDTLSGLGGNDVLDGGTGIDSMAGGAGGDTYYVDDPSDVVTEAVGSGSDTVFTTVDYALAPGSEVEFLTASAGSTGLKLTGNAFDNTIRGAAGDDILTDGGGRDALYGNDGDDVLIVSSGGVAGGAIYDGGAGSDTLRLDAAAVADFTAATLTGVEHVAGSSADDSLAFALDDFLALSTFDGGGGNDAVTLKFRYTLDVLANPGPTITGLEFRQLVGSSITDTATLSAQQFAAFDQIYLAGGNDTVNVVVNGTTDFTTAFPNLLNVEHLTLQGTGSVRLTVAEFDQFTAIAAGLDVTLSDTASHLQGLAPGKIALLAGKGVDRIGSTTESLDLSVAQYQALGTVALSASDAVRLADSGAALAALTPLQIGGLTAKRIDGIDATDDALTLSADQAMTLGDVGIAQLDLVTVADTGSRLGTLTAADLAAFNAAQIDRLDATDDALALTLDQFNALNLISVVGDDALTLAGTAGDDELDFPRQPFNVADRIDGDGGNDVLWLVGDYPSLAFEAATVNDVEMLLLGAGHDYGLTLADGNVGAGQEMTVNAGNLGAANSFSVDGSAETDGSFRIVGGDGANTMTGGNGGDTMWLGGGADLVRYTAAAQSTSTDYDVIVGFDAVSDHLHVVSGVTAIDAPITAGALSKLDFDGDLATAMAGLAAHHAALFTADAGGFAGRQFLVVDTNGTAGYQAGADLVLRLDSAAHLDQLGTGTFL